MQARRSHKKSSSRIPCNSWFDWRWSRHHTCSGDDHSRRPVAAVVQELLKGMVAVCCGENNLACRREVSHYNNISSKLVHLQKHNWSRWYTVQYCSRQITLIWFIWIYMDLYNSLIISVLGIHLSMQKLHWSFDWRWSRHNTCSWDEHSRPLQTTECFCKIS